jgi:hypothetical protein
MFLGKSVKMPIATGRVGSFAATFTGMAIAGTSNQHLSLDVDEWSLKSVTVIAAIVGLL